MFNLTYLAKKTFLVAQEHRPLKFDIWRSLVERQVEQFCADAALDEQVCSELLVKEFKQLKVRAKDATHATRRTVFDKQFKNKHCVLAIYVCHVHHWHLWQGYPQGQQLLIPIFKAHCICLSPPRTHHLSLSNLEPTLQRSSVDSSKNQKDGFVARSQIQYCFIFNSVFHLFHIQYQGPGHESKPAQAKTCELQSTGLRGSKSQQDAWWLGCNLHSWTFQNNKGPWSKVLHMEQILLTMEHMARERSLKATWFETIRIIYLWLNRTRLCKFLHPSDHHYFYFCKELFEYLTPVTCPRS